MIVCMVRDFLISLASWPEYKEMMVFWNVMLYSPVGGYQCSEECAAYIESKCMGCGIMWLGFIGRLPGRYTIGFWWREMRLNVLQSSRNGKWVTWKINTPIDHLPWNMLYPDSISLTLTLEMEAACFCETWVYINTEDECEQSLPWKPKNT